MSPVYLNNHQLYLDEGTIDILFAVCASQTSDEAGSPTEGFDDQTELNDSNQTVEEGDEETDKDEITIQQQTTSPELSSTRTPKIHSRKFRE